MKVDKILVMKKRVQLWPYSWYFCPEYQEYQNLKSGPGLELGGSGSGIG